MKICPITYEPLTGSQPYSAKGLKLLSPQLKDLKTFPYSAEEQRREAEAHSSKISIQGVQPKLSARLNMKESRFEIVDRGGRFILKPQTERYRHLPENEDLTMRLAEVVGISVPLHGLLYSQDGSMTYFIRRFDRIGHGKKLHIEDFAQLSGESRDTKYRSSMEKVAKIIDLFCSFPAIEKVKLFRQTLFSFLVGNEDMHLKNFSLILQDDKVELSPAYDLINSTLVIVAPKEEMALPIRGRKNQLNPEDLIQYFALNHLSLSPAIVKNVLDDFKKVLPLWKNQIRNSFLPQELQLKYAEILSQRLNRMGLGTIDVKN